MKTYRVEEYLSEYVCLDRDDLYKPEILEQFYNTLSLYNSLGDHNIFYEFCTLKNLSKEKLFEILKTNCLKKSNIIDFLVNKILPEAKISLEKFNDEANKHKELFLANDFINKQININNFYQKLEKLNKGIENFEFYIFNLIPKENLIVLSHNDLHMLNMMKKKDNSKIKIFDHEYSCYNFLGFDICNYISETFFCMTHNEFPFYKTYNTNFNDYGDDLHYKVFLDYIDKFYKERRKEYNHLDNFDFLINEKIKTKDYYLRMIGLSAMLWFVFAIFNLNYQTSICKNNTDFFCFAFERISIYEDYIKDNIK